MANSLPYSVGVVVLMVASMLVVAENADPCLEVSPLNNDQDSCTRCVRTPADSKTNCTFEETATGALCTSKPDISQQTTSLSHNATECQKNVPTTPAPPPAPTTNATTTTPVPPTTNATTTVPPTTNGTTTVPPTTNGTTTVPPTTNGTTTTVPPTPTTNGTTTAVPTTTPTPSNSSTVAPTPTPAPRSGGGMSFGSFFGGIVFTLCCSGLGYLIWRFYRARVDQNYHTFSNPTF